MKKKLAPKNVKLCPSCPKKTLDEMNLEGAPQFTAKPPEKTSQVISIIKKPTLSQKVHSLF